MRNRRQIKKISKLLLPFFKDAWLCNDNEELFYNDRFLPGTSSKGVMCVGGGRDYWGEGEEVYTVLEKAEQYFGDWQTVCGCSACHNQFDLSYTGKCGVSERRRKLRPTYKNLVRVLKEELSQTTRQADKVIAGRAK
ncbi:hypothetical protein TUMSATVNIG1_61350 (plasmid) [Vibrio nigripulchritudo]|uniref:hypothetical protein n=1 Tax=Vibrio nigripulchritudo TaxID=28173 RepID=UPI00190CEFBD|nr:hypothetical protein [Vibrio nigripulchritudo]BCL74151.1 hypothetical protein VNTUMSATTG_60880 [Vibrio nigripulchritudo]BDU35526.1 hypothetical protein TUMSATVNIG1_61350 [Vibrio nigripulchritudo]